MGRQLVANVWVDGVLYEAGSSPSKEVADAITNPKAWDSGQVAADGAAPEEADAKPAGRSRKK